MMSFSRERIESYLGFVAIKISMAVFESLKSTRNFLEDGALSLVDVALLDSNESKEPSSYESE
jgi:hypothetical protein